MRFLAFIYSHAQTIFMKMYRAMISTMKMMVFSRAFDELCSFTFTMFSLLLSDDTYV